MLGDIGHPRDRMSGIFSSFFPSLHTQRQHIRARAVVVPFFVFFLACVITIIFCSTPLDSPRAQNTHPAASVRTCIMLRVIGFLVVCVNASLR